MIPPLSTWPTGDVAVEFEAVGQDVDDDEVGDRRGTGVDDLQHDHRRLTRPDAAVRTRVEVERRDLGHGRRR